MRTDEDVSGLRGARRGGAAGPGSRLAGWVALVVMAAGGCASSTPSTPPAAVQVGERFPVDRYIVGRGCVASTGNAVEDRASADQVARAEVAKQIEVQVTQLAEDVQREDLHAGRVFDDHAIRIQTREWVEKKLMGVRIVERNAEAGMQCAVAVLDKPAMARRVREDVDGLRQEMDRSLASVDEAERRGDGVAELRGMARAIVAMNKLAVLEKLLLDLGYAVPEHASGAEIRERWARELEGIRLVPVGGGGQVGKAGESLDLPLRVRAVNRQGGPVANLPLKVLRHPEGCRVQMEAQTDSSGEASFRVLEIPASGAAAEEIAVGIDWTRLLPLEEGGDGARPRAGWDPRETVFTYRLPDPGEYRVGVAVYAGASGGALDRSPVQAALLEGLQRVGFPTLDLLAPGQGLGGAFQTKPELDAARRALRQKAEILVLADISVRFSSRTSQGFVFYLARGLVQAVSVKDGTVLATVDRAAKGGGLEQGRAARKAVLNLSKILADSLGPTLVGALD